MLSQNKTSPLQIHLGRATSPSFTADNGLAHCICYYFAMPSADESNHPAAGTLHPHRSATFFP